MNASTQYTDPQWLSTARNEAWTAYQNAPQPPHTSEAWKYTDTEALTASNVTVGTDTTVTPETPKPESPTPDQGDMVFMDLHTALQEKPQLVQSLLEQSYATNFSSIGEQTYGGQRYIYQNDALWNYGYVAFVPKGVRVSAPVIANIQASSQALFPRTIIVLEEGAELTYIENLKGNGESCHARTHIYCAPNSSLQYASVQHWGDNMRYLAQQHATVEGDARFTSLQIALGSATTKTVTETVMAAPGAEANIYGLTFANNAQHIDHHTLQTHRAPNTMSNLLFKAALTDQAKSIYTGLIKMGEEAQQGAAYQSSRNLLLSDACAVNAIPQLEIEANDVKCSHGATMGSIDPEQLYYLTSRGLSRSDAERMIVTGFFEELVAELPSEELADVVRESIASKLEA